MLGIPKNEEAPPTPQHPLSPMGDACSRMDLTAIHQILVMTHYKDDEGTNEVIPLMKYKDVDKMMPTYDNLLRNLYLNIDWFSYPSKSGPSK